VEAQELIIACAPLFKQMGSVGIHTEFYGLNRFEQKPFPLPEQAIHYYAFTLCGFEIATAILQKYEHRTAQYQPRSTPGHC
jgi:hypothetical protein